MSRILVAAFLFAAIAGIAVWPAIAASPVIVVTPLSDHPSAKVTVSGTGFGASEAVDIYFDTTDEVLAFTDSAGKFAKHSIKVAVDAAPGEHWVTAVGRHDGAAAQKLFTVATTWAEFGFKPNGKRDNPYENVISTSNVTKLDTAWVAKIGGEIDFSSPAVADGVAYVGVGGVGVNGGSLYAFDASSGVKLWSSVLGSYAVYPSPAVANGIVYIGAGDGKLYAFNTASGAPMWTVPTDGFIISSPAVAAGIVYVGSGDSSLYAFDANTGKKLWSAATGGPIEDSSPAVANGLVYVASLDGNLYAFDAATGTKIWTAAVAGYYPSSPAVANGIVYIGNGGTLYSFDAVTGTALWSEPVTDVVGSAPAVGNGVVYVGSGVNADLTGRIYAFDAATGASLWSVATDHPLLSSPALANGIVYVGSIDNYGYGGKVYAFDAVTGDSLWVTVADVRSYSPTVVNGFVYVSTNGYLYAYALDGGNNAVYKLRHTLPPSLATLHPDHRLKLRQ